jgi:hypothetical protein
MTKSYVSIEQKVCHVCTKVYDTDSLLMDKRLKPTFDMRTVTGYGICPEHTKVIADGYVIMIECSNAHEGDRMETQEANRTGRVGYVNKEAFAHVMEVPPPKGGLCMCEEGMLDTLAKIAGHPTTLEA